MNIVLIGMPGAGKSTLGVLVAKAMGMDYVDTDIVIQQREGRLLQDIIDSDGIAAFLKIEAQIVSELKIENSVVATGGSIVYSDQAIKALKKEGQIFYLQVPCEEIARRLKNMTTRGIAAQPGRSLQDIYEERVPLYLQYADQIIDCANKSTEDCVSEIAACVKAGQ